MHIKIRTMLTVRALHAPLGLALCVLAAAVLLAFSVVGHVGQLFQWQSDDADADVFEDRRLEIVSSTRISLHNQIEWLDRQLDAN